MSNSTRIAILIDAENVPASYAKSIFDSSSFGIVNLKQAFGNFSSNNFQEWKRLGGDQSITIRHVDPGKNSVDIALTLAAIATVHASTADQYWIVSRDGGFAPLVRYIKSKGFSAYVLAHQPPALALQRCLADGNLTGTLGMKQPQSCVEKTVDALIAIQDLTWRFLSETGVAPLSQLGNEIKQATNGRTCKEMIGMSLSRLVKELPFVESVQRNAGPAQFRIKRS
jgi:hypothetical protein